MRSWVLVLAIACGGGRSPIAEAPDAVVLPDARCSFTSLCNPVAQTGCCANEQCTWFHDTAEAGHIGCTAVGAVAVGEACTITGAVDDCAKGAVCSAGVCKAICDVQASPPASGCSPDQQCVVDPTLFSSGEIHVAGVCEPSAP